MVDLSSLSVTAFQNIPDFVYYVINMAITAAALITVVSLIISGFKYMLSFGDEKKIKAATQSMVYSLIGLVLVFIAPTVIEFVINNILKV